MMKTPFWFRRFGIVSLLLLPLAAVYFAISKILFICRSFWAKRSKTPVICIGGLLAGGVGKTPVVREIAKYLSAPVIMRGYGGAHRRGHVLPSDSARDVGDEPKMLVESGLDVYVGDRRDNIDTINLAAAAHIGGGPPRAIVMDDGFQNPRIKKDISVLVFDASIGLGSGMLLPSGPLRETLREAIRRADAILIIRQDNNGHNMVRVLRMAKRMKKPAFFVSRELDTSGFFGKYVVFAGIGYPFKFFDSLRMVPSIRIVEKIAFPDHHAYDRNDIIRLFRKAREFDARLIATEKDVIKLPRNIRKKVRFVPMKIIIQPNFYVWLERKLEMRN